MSTIVRNLLPPTLAEVTAVAASLVTRADLDDFVRLACQELANLYEGNYARFRLRPSEYRAWRLRYLGQAAVKACCKQRRAKTAA
jgi:hypothetical protein